MHHVLLNTDVFRPPEFARLVGVTPPTIVSWIKSTKLKGHKIGGRYYVPATELDKLKDQ
jgi:excisionase family DNA binding protein